jgi:transcriptional regulator with XRE-family HTH domain
MRKKPKIRRRYRVDAVAIGRAVKILRQKRGLSLAQAGALAPDGGIDAAHWFRVESGYNIPKLQTLLDAAQALDVTPDELLRRASII